MSATDWINTTDLLSIRGLWMLLGMALATAVSFFVNRKVLKLQTLAAEALADTLDRQIKALEGERNHYRDQLHRERNERQACELRAKELEARPNLTSLVALLEDQKDWMQKLGDTLREHSESDARIFGKLEESVARLPGEMERMSNAFDERQRVALSEIRKSHGR